MTATSWNRLRGLFACAAFALVVLSSAAPVAAEDDPKATGKDAAAAAEAAPAAPSPQILEVKLDDATSGKLNVGIRHSEAITPAIEVGGVAVEMAVESRERSHRWQPLFLLIDSSNITEERLAQVKDAVKKAAKAEFAMNSQLVVVADQLGARLDAKNPEAVDGVLTTELLNKLNPIPSSDPRNPTYTTLDRALGFLNNMPVSRGRPWAMIFSSLCMSPDAKPANLSLFRGPVTFLTWDADLHRKCQKPKAKWIETIQGSAHSVLNLDKPEDAEAVAKARAGLDVPDEQLSMTGIDYVGGAFNLKLSLPGSEGQPFNYADSGNNMPHEWARAATMAAQAESRALMYTGFGFMVLLVIGIAFMKARSTAVDFQKWEAVGEAEDLSDTLDPDAWNATIFQLTGAMPVIQEIRKAVQLGPGGAEPGDEATVDAPKPKAPPPPAAKAKAEPAGASMDATQAAGPVAPGPTAGGPPSTGMTVNIPILDDGTGYDASRPFEVGVLLNGKPVSRKTKKFRKVFSVGRATDNRVVIQKDDTVHRYHVVVRPAQEGKEWWLVVSPTASNRTNLNGKDLRAGGRYRLPERFRLQLGEATEIRGRVSKDAQKAS